MAQTAQLGRLDGSSRLGNFILGLSSIRLGATQLLGVSSNAIGQSYDFAMGFDPGTGIATMYGYVIAPGQQWTEQTNLQDLDSLIQSDSTATTDKDLTHWPKVSQGDWTHGERQVVFVSNQQMYSSDGGLDFTKPNYVTVMPRPVTTTLTTTGTYNVIPTATDNNNWYSGISTTGHNFVIGTASGITQYNLGGGAEVLDVQATAAGVFFGNSTGIWRVDPSGATVQVTNDGIGPVPTRSIAYFNNAVYYITNSDARISAATSYSAGAGTTKITAGAFETQFSFICSTAAGLLYGAWVEWSATSYANKTVLYTFDGTTSTRVDEIPGKVRAAHEMNGIVYLLCDCIHPVDLPNAADASTPTDYTLYTFTPSGSSGTLAIVDDPRYLLPDFQAVNPSPTPYVRGGLSGDGKFIYIGWPGYGAKRYDPALLSISSVAQGSGGIGVANLSAHKVVASSAVGIVDILSAGSTVTINQYNGSPGTGQYVTSYFDFNTPSITKYFRSVDIELVYPLPPGASVTVEYQLDSVTTWSSITPVPTLTNILTAYLPTGTKASRTRFRITLISGSGGTPTLRSMSVKANLGRVWKTTVTCKRNQELRSGEVDNQGALARDLIANIESTYYNASKAILFIPSANSTVEQVNAILEDYTLKQYTPGVRTDDRGVQDCEGEVDVTLVESL